MDTQARIELYAKLLRGGHSPAQIARLEGISRSAVGEFIKTHEIPTQICTQDIPTPASGYLGITQLYRTFGLKDMKAFLKVVGFNYDTFRKSQAPFSPNMPNLPTLARISERLGVPVAALVLSLFKVTPNDLPHVLKVLKAQDIPRQYIDELLNDVYERDNE